MKPYIFLISILSALSTSCFQDCIPQDVKVGDIALTVTTKAFIQQFVGKKVIYKNANGREVIFDADKKLTNDSSEFGLINVKLNCKAGLSPKSESWDFFQTERVSVYLTSDSFSLGYRTYLTQNTVVNKSDTSNLYEVMSFSVGDKVACGVVAVAIFSDRGFPNRRSDTSDTYRLFREVKDTTIGNKRFQNINVKMPSLLCSGGNTQATQDNQTPIEIFFNLKEGVVAFKTKNGMFWFFDRIQ
jgi:hypothetical protein